jgi:hypothetical protein
MKSVKHCRLNAFLMDISVFKNRIVKRIKIHTLVLKMSMDNFVIGILILINVSSQIVVQNYL